MPKRIKISLSLFALAVSLAGQTTGTGSPLFQSVDKWHEIDVDPSLVEQLRAVDQPKDQPFQFAVPVPVSLTPANSGYTVRTAGETVWILPLSSKGALSLNIILSPFRLTEGAEVFVYDASHTVVRRASSADDPRGAGIMPVLPVPGDKLVLECHFPGKTIPDGAIGISQLGHDYLGFFGLTSSKDIYFGGGGNCEVDVNCSTNSTYLLASRSVVRLLIAGAELCTGVMVNNTGKEYKAYVLTAQHCIETSSQASATIFVFNYASPWCDGPDISNMHSITGAQIKATNKDIDFTLVEMSSFPSMVLRPWFSGWDITAGAPNSTFAIHHPEGDVMKLTIDNNSPVTSSYPLSGYASNSFWQILRWDMGTTENGSSGGPLFDQYGRLRGTLTGGAANCSSPVNDYFAKLNRMFNISNLAASNLKPWLDPLSTGATVAAGRDPYAYNLSKSDTLSNPPKSDAGTTDQYSAPGFGYSTGNNSDSIISYADYFSFAGSGEIAWIRARVGTTSYTSAADSVRFYIWAGGSRPGTVIASRSIRLTEVKNNFEVEIDFGKTVAVTGPFYVGYRVFYRDNLTVTQPQFSVKRSAVWPLDSQNTAWFNDGSGWKPFTQHPGFPAPISLSVSVIMVENSVLNAIGDVIAPHDSTMTVFPNPFTDGVSFRSDLYSARKTALTVYDQSGRVVHSSTYQNIFPGVLTVELPSLVPGLYHYRLINDAVVYTGSFVKSHRK